MSNAEANVQILPRIEFESPPLGVDEREERMPIEDSFDIGSGESLVLGLRGSSSDESKEISSEPRWLEKSTLKYIFGQLIRIKFDTFLDRKLILVE